MPPLAERPVPLELESRSMWSLDLGAASTIWRRDLIRFWGDKPRILASLGQPFLHFFVLGTGLGPMLTSAQPVPLRTFLYPGVISLSVLFTCFLSAGSLVTDREFGFMRVMLVAPVRRGAILLGKCCGGATIGVLQGALVVALGGLVGVPYDPVLILTLLAELLLLSFTLTAFGVLLAVHVRRMQSFLAIMQLTVTPMYFMSGALFPVSGLPRWLSTATRFDPLSYAVDPMRRAVLGRLGVFSPGLTWGGTQLTVSAELALLALLALGALVLATHRFERPE